MLYLLFLFSINYAQKIEIVIDGVKGNTGSLCFLQGEKIVPVDSVKINDKGIFYYSGEVLNHSGLYRLIYDDNHWIDFVYDREDVHILAKAEYNLDSVRIINSESNKLYYSFIKLNRQFKIKTELLQFILSKYPKDDDYYSFTQKKLSELQSEYIRFINKDSQDNPLSFVARYIRTSQLPVINFSIPIGQQLLYLKSHSLDLVDFTDDELIYSDAFTNKTIEYLNYYRNPQLSKELLEKEFTIAVDSILNKAKINGFSYQHLVEYLIDGFKRFGFNMVLDYIIENYVIKDDLCLSEHTGKLLERRINQAKLLPVNSIAPNIVLPDTQGNELNLESISSEKLILLFYSSQCPHCKDLIPKLYDSYINQPKKSFEVVAVSLDTDKNDWLKFIKNYSPAWKNVSDLKGWNSKSAASYFIYAIPAMFLLNKKREIISKPGTIYELLQYFVPE